MVDRRRAVRIVLTLAALVLLGYVLRQAQPRRVAALLLATPSLGLALLPYLLYQFLDAGAMVRLLRAARIRAPWFGMLKLRIAADAVGTSLPSGQVIAEGTAVHLLRAHGPLPGRLAAVASRRVALGLAHGIMVLLSAVLGVAALRRASAVLIGWPGLERAVAGTGLLVVAAFGLIAALLRGGAAARALLGLVSRLPSSALRSWAAARMAGADELDRDVGRCLGRPPGGLVVVGLLVAGMLVETFETFFILDRLHAGLSFLDVLSFEPLVSLARALFFLVPAGLGIQDMGYLAFLTALGVPDAASVAAAFLVTKRGKELFWIAVGWVGLAWAERPAPSPASLPSPAAP